MVNLIVIGAAVFYHERRHNGRPCSADLSTGKGVSSYELLVGFASAWLAFSGLESISQLSPAMRLPLRRTTRYAMTAVIITMVVTSPVLTALSIGLLPEQIKATQSERFISELGWISRRPRAKDSGGPDGIEPPLVRIEHGNHRLLSCFSGARAAGFLPKILELRNRAFNTPHIAVLIATSVPIAADPCRRAGK